MENAGSQTEMPVTLDS